MPKLKTCKAITKRFRLTASGKLKRKKGGKSHLASGKSSKRKRRLRRAVITHEAFSDRLVSMIHS